MSGIGEPYRCEVCSGIFRKTRSDEEALAEQAELWQPRPGENGTICEDCFQQVMAWAQAEHPEYLRRG